MAKQQQKIFAGAGILAIAGLIAKILSAVYRVPFQNIVGNQGFYVYQQVYPIYGIGMVMALSGWPLFISKMVAEQSTNVAKQLVARRLFWLLALISVSVFMIIFFGAPIIAVGMQDTRLTGEIKAVAWMFLLMPVLATTRGYTQGQFDMVPTAISQVIEQVVRVVMIIGVAWYGMHHAWQVYQIGTFATFAATIAGLVTSLYLIRALFVFKPLKHEVVVETQFAWRILWQRLWREGGLLAMLAALLVCLQLMDSFSVKGLLEQGGLASITAETTKGVYDRGQPLVQLGMVMATGLGTSLLPTLHVHWQKQANEALQHDFQMTVRLSFVLAMFATVGLIAIMPVVNQFLFSSRQGDVALSWYVTIIVPATLITVLTSVLQSINRTQGLFSMVGLTVLVKVALNYLLIPYMGIVGASLATLLALLPLLAYTIYQVPNDLWHAIFNLNWWLRLSLSVILMAIVAILVRIGGDHFFGVSRVGSILTTILAGMSGMFVAIYLVLKLKIFNEEELSALPKGHNL